MGERDRLLRPHLVEQFDGGQVERSLDSPSHRDGTIEFVGVIPRFPVLQRPRHAADEGSIHEYVGGRVALREGRAHDDGLEGRARLAPRLGSAVERKAAEIGSARQGADRSCSGVECDYRALHRLLPLQEEFFRGAIHPDHASEKQVALSEPVGFDVSGQRHFPPRSPR